MTLLPSTRKIAEEIAAGAEPAELAERYGCVRQTIYDKLNRAGYSIRDLRNGNGFDTVPEPPPITQLFDDSKDLTWRESSACAQVDPELFFPEKGQHSTDAKTVCAGCPVTTECMTYAMSFDRIDGIWAGTTENQRRRLKRGAA